MHAVQDLVRAHLSLHPGMELVDCIKLLYQSEMGSEHLVADEAAFCRALHLEMDTVLPGAAPGAKEDIGNGRHRVPLSLLEDGPRAATFARLCTHSAAQYPGSVQRLAQNMQVLRQMAAQGLLPYAPQAAQHIDEYIESGLPPVHHSSRFKALYAPHYRVLDGAAALYLPVFAAIDKAMAQKPYVLVCIDGMSCAGKSNLARLLRTVYGCGVVRTDDFFLPAALRSRERLLEPGGNIDYARLAGVAAQARHRFPFEYAAYDCGTDTMNGVVHVPGGPLTVLEGAYALHPKANAAADVRVFLCVNAAVQAQRVAARTPDKAERFLQEWIPMENHYFGAFGVREGCDVVLDTTQLSLPGG